MAGPIDDFREFFQYTNRAWDPSIWPRAFWFDVFLSHRRGDGSSSLADALATAGVKAYHDGDQPVAEQQVLLELDAALKHSRFVAVCLSDTLSESAFCRAEFVPALEHASACGIPRVLVVTKDPAVARPPELAGVLEFDVSTDSGVAALADYVRRGNTVGFGPDIADAASAEAAFKALCDSAKRQILERHATAADQQVDASTRPSLALAMRAIGSRVLEALDDGIVLDQALQFWQDCVFQAEELPDEAGLEHLSQCAQILMREEAPEVRLVATELFVWVAEKGGVANEERVLAELIRRHTVRGGDLRVVRQLLRRAAAVPGLVAARDVERAIAVHPLLFENELAGLAATAPSPVRVKLGLPGLSGSLSAENKLEIIHRRAVYLREQLDQPDPPSGYDVEVLVRDQLGPVRRGLDEASHPRVLGGPGGRILSTLCERNSAGITLFSRLDIEGMLSVLPFLYDVCRCDPGQTTRFVAAVADDIGETGFRATAEALRGLVPHLMAGGPLDDAPVHRAYNQEAINLGRW